MKLTDLDPVWLNDNVFIFLCPHCGKCWISCKNIPMGNKEQRELMDYFQLIPTGRNSNVILTEESCSWKFSGNDFTTLSVTPSIDASKGGHWHGFITNGEIT